MALEGGRSRVLALALAATAISSVAASQSIDEFPINSSPSLIATGPDGNVWFIERGSWRIGRLNMASVPPVRAQRLRDGQQGHGQGCQAETHTSRSEP